MRDVLVFDAGQRGKRPGVWLVSGKTGALIRALQAHPGSLIVDARFVGDVDGDCATAAPQPKGDVDGSGTIVDPTAGWDTEFRHVTTLALV